MCVCVRECVCVMSLMDGWMGVDEKDWDWYERRRMNGRPELKKKGKKIIIFFFLPIVPKKKGRKNVWMT